jgi:hypothetical protein
MAEAHEQRRPYTMCYRYTVSFKVARQWRRQKGWLGVSWFYEGFF